MFWLTVFFIFVVLKLIVSLTNAKCKSKVCLVGKTALITGGNAGLGLQLAKELASRGCKIIIADKADATNTVKDLIKETHNSHITSKVVDFTSFKSVRLFAEELKKDIDKLDILANNAGTGIASMTMTEDGLQEMMQINYFSHFLLTHLILELLLKAGSSRIIYTNSWAAHLSSLREDNFKGEELSYARPFSGGPYGNSKIAGAIMSKLLAKKLQGTKVTSNTFHPGFVRTNIWNAVLVNKFGTYYPFFVWNKIFGKSPEEGIQTVLYLACADEVEKVSGKYFAECTSMWQPKEVYNDKLCARIWELSEQHVKLKPEEKIQKILEKCKMNH